MNRKLDLESRPSTILAMLTIILSISIGIAYYLIKSYLIISEIILILFFFITCGLVVFFVCNIIITIIFLNIQKETRDLLDESARAKNIYRDNSIEEIKFIYQYLLKELKKEKQLNVEIKRNFSIFLTALNVKIFKQNSIELRNGEIEVELKTMEMKIHSLIDRYENIIDEKQKFMNELNFKIKDLTEQISQSLTNYNELFKIVNNLKLVLGDFNHCLIDLEKVSNSTNFSNDDFEKSIEKVSVSSMNTNNLTVEWYNHVKLLNQMIVKIEGTVSTFTGLTNELTISIREIENILNTITDISTQTDLLALNASIEAARAGEHGKGFVVVSDNIKKLAQKITESIIQIEGLIKDVEGKTDKIVSVIKISNNLISDSYNEINITESNSAKISENLSVINKFFANFYSNLSQQNSNNQFTVKTINESFILLKNGSIIIDEFNKVFNAQNKKNENIVSTATGLSEYIKSIAQKKDNN